MKKKLKSGLKNGLFALLLITLISCKTDDYYSGNDATLSFSQELITFDTLFTSLNSITKVLSVKNPYKKALSTDITLVGGDRSYYSLNINGISAKSLRNIEIPAKDSILIFIKINIDPNGGNIPMLVSDTIAFFTNGNRQNVTLLAFGEDAHFIIPTDRLVLEDSSFIEYSIIANYGEDIKWTNDKPYVIYGQAIIYSFGKLTIEAGTRIYCHSQSGLWVYTGGGLTVNGTADQPVVFQGDRREEIFASDYAQWGGISINSTHQVCKINYAIIKNAGTGIQAGTFSGTRSKDKLILTNSIIHTSQIGLNFYKFNLEAANNVVYDCQSACFSAQLGGNYTLVNNTFYNEVTMGINGRRTTPAVYLSNYVQVDDNTAYCADLECFSYNNIIYGVADSTEFYTSIAKEATANVELKNCLLKATASAMKGVAVNVDNIFNQNPLFTDYRNNDFSLQSASPCIGKGIYHPAADSDIKGKYRNNPPCIGAFEY
ncbi:MAG: hypothetical protein LBR36_06980 [Bacteroidales bacterium]|jgi:hypothetical protein|nr:hypothetical protein [Bacteroidales bacterium]